MQTTPSTHKPYKVEGHQGGGVKNTQKSDHVIYGWLCTKVSIVDGKIEASKNIDVSIFLIEFTLNS